MEKSLFCSRKGGRVARWFVFKPKIPNLDKFWRVLQWKILVYFMTIWSILRPLEIFYGHLVYFSPFWYFVPRKIWQPYLAQRTNQSLFFAGKNVKKCAHGFYSEKVFFYKAWDVFFHSVASII
jgi:hypothetical protein